MEDVPCGLCRSSRRRPYVRKFDLDLVQCRSCGLVYANPRLREEDVLKRYDARYFFEEYLPAFKAGPDGFDPALIRKHYGLFLRILANAHSPGRKLLDIGCGAGFFLKAAEEDGWQGEGIEVSAAASAYGRDVLKVKVRTGRFETAGLSPRSFDVITLLDTIEHLPDPLASLEQARRLLKRGGLLLLNTPDLRSLSHVILGPSWAVLSPAEHLYNFSAKTLSRLLTQAGFRVIAIDNLLAFNPDYTHRRSGFRYRRWKALCERFRQRAQSWAQERACDFESTATQTPGPDPASSPQAGFVRRLRIRTAAKVKRSIRGDMLVALAVKENDADGGLS